MTSLSRMIQSARLVAFLTLVSRTTGLIREMIYSGLFGTGELLSAFRIAFMIPNLARRLFGEGALSAALIPALTECLEKQGEHAARRLAGAILKIVGISLITAVLLLEIGLWIIHQFQPDPALSLTAITLPYMPMVCCVAIFGAALNVRQHFAAPAAAPILLNVAIIVAGLGAVVMAQSDVFTVRVMGVSVVIAGVFQLVLMGRASRSVSFMPILFKNSKDSQQSVNGAAGFSLCDQTRGESPTNPEPPDWGELKQAGRGVFKAMAPAAIGLSAVQVNSLADYIIAYLFVVENGQRIGPAVLGYSQILYQLPLGVFGIGLATAIFPTLATAAAKGDREQMAKVFAQGLRLSLCIALPAAVGLAIVAAPLAGILFERGDFRPSDTQRVASTLVFYCIGLPAYFAQHLVVRAFYALKDAGTPARVALMMVGLNLVLNIILVHSLQERGLALATAVCAIIQILWLTQRLSFKFPLFEASSQADKVGGVDKKGQDKRNSLLLSFAKTFLATAVMALVLLVLQFDALPVAVNELPRLLRLIILVPAGVLAYCAAAWLLRIEEMRLVLRRSR